MALMLTSSSFPVKIQARINLLALTCSIADRIGADDCGSKESNVSTSTSINSGVPSPSGSSSPEDSRRSGDRKAFLQHITSSEAASENSPGRSSICSSSWMSKCPKRLLITTPISQENLNPTPNPRLAKHYQLEPKHQDSRLQWLLQTNPVAPTSRRIGEQKCPQPGLIEGRHYTRAEAG
ncbi:hypothetical protein RJ639_006791 [Escallonia herrerae]|uniref:Uncharacterized protein n=1 Tax=Escallonia herrerae TaxID=1293975 RepID=A0AA88VTE3_9ASTE|nr:hypothetical protein RJ639_006791 [Escallonia herrerae]